MTTYQMRDFSRGIKGNGQKLENNACLCKAIYDGNQINHIEANIFQMLQNAMQFEGMQNKDTHISNFLEISNTFKINGVSKDAIRWRLVPLFLKGRAKQCLVSLPRSRQQLGIKWLKGSYWSTFPLQRPLS